VYDLRSSGCKELVKKRVLWWVWRYFIYCMFVDFSRANASSITPKANGVRKLPPPKFHSPISPLCLCAILPFLPLPFPFNSLFPIPIPLPKYWHQSQHYFSAVESLLMRSSNSLYLLTYLLTYGVWGSPIAPTEPRPQTLFDASTGRSQHAPRGSFPQHFISRKMCHSSWV